jgi:hypothetical protein
MKLHHHHHHHIIIIIIMWSPSLHHFIKWCAAFKSQQQQQQQSSVRQPKLKLCQKPCAAQFSGPVLLTDRLTDRGKKNHLRPEDIRPKKLHPDVCPSLRRFFEFSKEHPPHPPFPQGGIRFSRTP